MATDSRDELRARLAALTRALEQGAKLGRAAEAGSSIAFEQVTEAVAVIGEAMRAVGQLDERTRIIELGADVLTAAVGGEAEGVDQTTRALFCKLLALGMSGQRISVARAAKSLYYGRRALLRRLTVAGMPNPSLVLAWGRLLGALTLYREGGRLHDVAQRAGVPDGFALSTLAMRTAGVRPSEWMERGGDVRELCERMVGTWRQEIVN